MKNSFISNQGEKSNNHTTNYAAEEATMPLWSSTFDSVLTHTHTHTHTHKHKKIEISDGHYVKLTSMPIYTNYQNMYDSDSDESESYDEIEVYSDFESDIEGDRYIDEEINMQQEMEVDNFEKEERARYHYFRVQKPDEMEIILPARTDMPSSDDMNAWYFNIIKTEEDEKTRSWAVSVLEPLFIRYLAMKKIRDLKQIQLNKMCELLDWKRTRSIHKVGISTLEPLPTNEELDIEYNEMQRQRTISNKIQAELTERIRMIAVRAKAKRDAERSQKIFRQKGKARAMARIGMNKNTKWHKDRRAGSLSIIKTSRKGQSIAVSTVQNKTGTGRRAQRKKKQAEEMSKQLNHAKSLPVPLVPEIKMVNYIPIEEETDEIELTDEQIAQRDKDRDEERKQEAEDLEHAIAAINKAHIAKEKRDEQEAILDKIKMEEIAQQQAEEQYFISTMCKNKDLLWDKKDVRTKRKKKTKRKVIISIHPTSEIKTFRGTMYEDDSDFAIRTEAFNILGDKEKLGKALMFTRLCRSVTQKTKCRHRICNFAHSVDQLQEKFCRFGITCKFVKSIGNGLYKNNKFGRTGKVCACLHPYESKEAFCNRLGLKYTTPKETIPVKSVKSVSTEVKSPQSAWKVQPTKSINAVVKCLQPNTLLTPPAENERSWRQIVIKSLSNEEKKNIYGKGVVKLIGQRFTEKQESIPISMEAHHETWDTKSNGFEKSHKTITKVIPQVKVKTPGFNWVKGEVLKPEKRIRKSRWDVPIPQPSVVSIPQPSVVPVVEVTTPRKRNRKSRWDVRIPKQSVVQMVDVKAVQAINNRIESDVKANRLFMERIAREKTKANDINERFSKMTDKKHGWVKVSRGVKSNKSINEDDEITTFRVSRDNAELALLSVIRSGITNFRIVYI